MFFLSMFLSGMVLNAQEVDSVAVAEPVVAVMSADTLAVADSVEMSDEEIMKMLATPQTDTVKKVVDRGFDVSRMVNARRQRSVDVTPFSNKPFPSSAFVSARLTTNKILTEDYGFGLMGGLSFGQWLHEDHAVRLTASYGQWQDNFDGAPITGMDLSASYLFNLSSYVGGYRTNRFAEVMIVAGMGYSGASRMGTMSHALNGHVGANVNLRMFKGTGFDFFIEPLAKIYTNGMAVSYAGNWRSWLSSFEVTCGLTYNIRPSKSPESPRLLPKTDGWFIFLSGGPHFQNSDLVYTHLGVDRSLGVHVNLGLGKYYRDYFAMRLSGAYSRGSWIIYPGDPKEYPCNYFAVRAEGMLDFVGLISKAAKPSAKKGEGSSKVRKDRKYPLFSASLLFGPEVGYMYKVDQDLPEEDHVPVITSAYLGLTGGVQAKFRLTERFSIFLEPRFSLLPYDAPAHDPSTRSQFRNYYDGVFNFNFGIEFML